jgi:plasmid replication initiation protein
MKQEGNVTKSNALIEASYKLSVLEQRIMLICISQVKIGEKLTDQIEYSVSVSDLVDLTGTASNAMYKELEKASARLWRREIWINEKPNGEGSFDHQKGTRWVQTINYLKDEGRVTLRFNTDMVPYLNDLTEQFTRYALRDVAAMTSSYAIRMFEMIAQWKSIGHRIIEIDFLRDAFVLGDKYKLLADLRRKVIEPSIEQINEHSHLNVSYEFQKTGRKTTHIRFAFGPKPVQSQLPIEPTEQTKEQKPKAPRKAIDPKKVMSKTGSPKTFSDYELSKLARPGESYQEALARIQRKQSELDV